LFILTEGGRFVNPLQDSVRQTPHRLLHTSHYTRYRS
jgi:hypothetical protein